MRVDGEENRQEKKSRKVREPNSEVSTLLCFQCVRNWIRNLLLLFCFLLYVPPKAFQKSLFPPPQKSRKVKLWRTTVKTNKYQKIITHGSTVTTEKEKRCHERVPINKSYEDGTYLVFWQSPVVRYVKQNNYNIHSQRWMHLLLSLHIGDTVNELKMKCE